MDQLLVSDAVDQAVAKIDFTPLRDQSVYLNTEFIKADKNAGIVSSEYVISALRHRIITSGCHLKDKKEDAEIVLEPRVGTLGSDEYNIVYGLPRSEAASSIASIAAGSTATLPNLPELALSKSEYRQGVAKINIYAYRRIDQSAVWQSGVAKSSATSRDTWIMGAGPFQRGSVYDGTRFAGSRVKKMFQSDENPDPMPIDPSYRTARIYDGITLDENPTRLAEVPDESEVK